MCVCVRVAYVCVCVCVCVCVLYIISSRFGLPDRGLCELGFTMNTTDTVTYTRSSRRWRRVSRVFFLPRQLPMTGPGLVGTGAVQAIRADAENGELAGY